MHDEIWELIYSFHMPLFMIISGCFCLSSFKLTFGDFLKKKSIQLLIPPTFCYLIIDVPYSIYFRGFHSVLTLNYLKCIIEDFWFLKSLFACYLIAYIHLKILNNIYMAAMFSILLVCLLPQFNFVYINFMLPFFWTGAILHKNINCFNENLFTIFAVSSFSFLGLLINWNGNFTIYHSPIIIDFGKENYQLIIIALYRFFIGFNGSLLVITVVKLLFDNYGNNYLLYLSNIGKSTMCIYIIQSYILERTLIKLNFKFIMPYLYFESFFITIGVIVISLVLIYFIKRNKILSFFLLGGKSVI